MSPWSSASGRGKRGGGPGARGTPDGVCNLVRYGNYYGTHSVTIPCNCYVSFDMGEIGCVTRSVTRMCSLRGQNVRFFCVTVSVTFTVTTTHMQHTAASRCVSVMGARRANTSLKKGSNPPPHTQLPTWWFMCSPQLPPPASARGAGN